MTIKSQIICFKVAETREYRLPECYAHYSLMDSIHWLCQLGKFYDNDRKFSTDYIAERNADFQMSQHIKLTERDSKTYSISSTGCSVTMAE